MDNKNTEVEKNLVKPSDKFYLVMVPDEGVPQAYEADSHTALVKLIEKHFVNEGSSGYAYAYRGIRIRISNPKVTIMLQDGEKTFGSGEDELEFTDGKIPAVRIDPIK